jgi:hypothetical protein
MTLDSSGNLGIGGTVSAKGYRIAGEGRNTTTHFTVEKADNGFILRSGRHDGDIAKVKVASSIEELKDLFIATMVEHRMEE